MTEVLVNDAAIRVVTTVAAQKLYDFDFLAYTASSVFAVFKTVAGVETVLTAGVHFTVTGLGVKTGGTIDITASGIVSAVGDSILIYRSVPIERTADYAIELRAAVFNRELDLGIMIDQELRRDTDRSMKVPIGTVAGTIISGVADTVPKFDAAGNLIEGPSVAEIEAAQGYAQEAEDARDDVFDRFLGAFASDAAANAANPTRPVGARYFNTASNADRIWSGSAWVVAPDVPNGSITDIKISDTEKVSPLGGVVRTISQRWRDRPHAFDWIPAAEHAAILARTSTFDAAAHLQTALNDIGAQMGGTLYAPSGKITLGAPIVFPAVNGVALVGAGRAGTTGDLPTRFDITHSAGPAFKLVNEAQSIEKALIWAVGTRASGAAGSNFGILLEAPDSPSLGARRGLIKDVTVRAHPSHGIVTSGEANHSRFENVWAFQNAGHGFMLDNGTVTGRTNLARPGMMTMLDCRANENGGYALKAGNLTSDFGCYRLFVQNFEAVRSTNVDTFAPTDHVLDIHGESMTVIGCGIGGGVAGVATHWGIQLAGRSNQIFNNRYIETPRAVQIVNVSGHSPMDNIIDGILPDAAAAMNPAVSISASAVNTTVIARNSNNITTVASGGIDTVVIGPQLIDALSVKGVKSVEAGTFSATGLTNGKRMQVDGSTGVLDSSRTVTSITEHAAFFNPNGKVGVITTSGTATAYTTSSDKRLKENPRDFDAGAILDAIEVWLFDWKSGGSGYGVFAQDCYEVFPDPVAPGEGGDDDRWSVDYSKFVPLILAEVKKLRQRVAALEKG